MERKHYILRRRGLLIGILLMPLLAWAEVTVIFDSGHTRSLAPYLEILESSEHVNHSQPTRGNTLGAADIQTLLPIRSPGLSPGPMQSRAHNRPFARPFFLIGSDPRSRQWLVKHRERLKAIGAVGMLVQADTLEDLQATARLSGGLPIMPASAADIASVLGVSHYPVLVTSQGIEQ